MEWDNLLSAITAIWLAWFSYNQTSKNKITEAKIERWKQEEKDRAKKNSENSSKIYGILWQILHDLAVDRVYILQPHPEKVNHFVSISMEVKRNGIAAMKPVIQKMHTSDIAAFAGELATRDFMFYKDVNQEVKDKKARAILATNGGVSAIIRRLTNDDNDWKGSIFLEFTHPMECDPAFARKVLAEAASTIQYILPDIQE